ncbi:16S rRNA (adenine(1518)-N(6)/adenine(1519)-N(6))-dimethyltransferase RsmA [Acetivibrio straminisolvens]|jgi:16S rRNA (adenine1518-N6/adenine1519-N6)-dimethyltransferase|uniref:Ribosomal RNA small subunit methyltransferase A n=1 Tax=Acetivibrio straminisolvens JCM 21531 TaxID=1294263 RepID=W4V9J8_9FIRM|nr:16S rRNA (adenine(1518)-N(6)/adenine(1519)-N(6))-dimethyltransferase RsmA [Acetivibrio straminisolvens]GAE90085.1 dimethyladenosine transferase [Acetivibrio straminisolvens JCM 21531]
MGGNTKKLIQKYNLRLTKSLGQNFLIDDNVVKRIVDAAQITENDMVIEIGPGVGSMTVELAQRAGKVIAVEIDKKLIPALQENLGEFSNVNIINKDIMDVNINELRDSGQFGNIKVVANLPYYITTPIIMKLLEEENDIGLMVFMVQKEVAQRMTAAPGKKDYGALSVAVQYYTKPEKAFDVPPHCFIPQPEVDSTVIKLNVNETPPVKLMDKDFFFMVVKAAFGQRRKTLVNALYNFKGFQKTKEEIKEILNQLGIDENARGETLSISQFAELSNLLFKCS